MVEFDGEASKIAAAIVFVVVPVASLLRRYAGPLQSEIRRRLSGRPVRTSREMEKVDDGIELDCVVCLCRVAAGERLLALPCDHRFHCGCIEEWLQERSTCPLCRSPASASASASAPAPAPAPAPATSGGGEDEGRVRRIWYPIERVWKWMESPLIPELTWEVYENSYYLSPGV